MSIIISKNGMFAKKVELTGVPREDYLQQYVDDNPAVIPLDAIKENIRLLILAREFSTPSGPIDALGVDEEGNIYVIETKLYKNPDKRFVVAQALDYGAALWSGYEQFDEFVETIEQSLSKKFPEGLRARLGEFFGIAENDVVDLLDRMKLNLSQGQFRFVVLMNKCHDRLKDLIAFINQNSNFTIYGCELEFYRHEDFEIIIPSLYGAEVRKNLHSGNGIRTKRKWDEASYLQAVDELDKETANAIKRVYSFCKQTSIPPMTWGSGISGSFNPKYRYKGQEVGSLFSVYTHGGIQLNLGTNSSDEAINKFRTRFRQQLNERLQLSLSEGKPAPFITATEWTLKVEILIEVISDLIATPS